MNTIKQIKNLKNKTVLLRGDLDVPLKNGKAADDFRLKRLLPSIEYLNKKGAKIIIMGHLGRPDGEVVASLSMNPVAEELIKLLGVSKKEQKLSSRAESHCHHERSIAESRDLFTDSSTAVGMTNSFKYYSIKENIFLLENLRFYAGEEKNDLKFAKKLAALGDIYVNDAFANSHRKHASIAGITKYLPSYAGLNLVQEVKVLKKVMEKPKRPAVAIMGGVKLETKLPLIEKLAGKFDYVLVGGRLGLEMSSKKQNIILPVDYAGSGKFDIGKRTIKLFTGILSKAKTIIWNGPMGKYEDKRYLKGTKEVAVAIINSKAYSVAGGGDVIFALDKLKMIDEFDFISTGGGAMLEFLERGTLAGLKELGFYK